MTKLYIFLFLLTPSFIIAQENIEQTKISDPNHFEGQIVFVKNTNNEITYYNCYVKNEKAKIDIIENNKIDNSFIFDLDKQEITALSASKKLFTGVPCRPFKKNIDEDDLIIIKSQNKRIINGYNCIQWRVKSKSQKTEVAYWVANENFDIFRNLLKLWNRPEKTSDFFLNIPDIDGYLPILSVERTLLRDEKSRLSIVDINKTIISDDVFKVPSDYKAFEQ